VEVIVEIKVYLFVSEKSSPMAMSLAVNGSIDGNDI